MNKKTSLLKLYIQHLVNYYLQFKFDKLNNNSLKSLGWKFGGFKDLETARGYCNQENKSIDMGKSILFDISIDKEQLKTIILHEISHAVEIEIFGSTKDHNERYKRVCYYVGKQTNVSGYMIYTETASATDLFNKNKEIFY